MDDLMGLVSAHHTTADADDLFKTVFYLIVCLRSDDCSTLGARLIEDCVYIDTFIHQDQLGAIQ